jgi:hypothetical protein
MRSGRPEGQQAERHVDMGVEGICLTAGDGELGVAGG